MIIEPPYHQVSEMHEEMMIGICLLSSSLQKILGYSLSFLKNKVVLFFCFFFRQVVNKGSVHISLTWIISRVYFCLSSSSSSTWDLVQLLSLRFAAASFIFDWEMWLQTRTFLLSSHMWVFFFPPIISHSNSSYPKHQDRIQHPCTFLWDLCFWKLRGVNRKLTWLLPTWTFKPLYGYALEHRYQPSVVSGPSMLQLYNHNPPTNCTRPVNPFQDLIHLWYKISLPTSILASIITLISLSYHFRQRPTWHQKYRLPFL